MINHSTTKITPHGDDVLAWIDLTSTDNVGQEFEMGQHTELHVQVLGEFGGASVLLLGSNHINPHDDSHWSLAVDRLGFPITFETAATMKRPDVLPRWLRPKIEGGDETTKVSVLIALRRSVK